MRRLRHHPKILPLLAIFLAIYIPLFFMLSLCYVLSDADFFGSPAFEAPDLMSEPACSPGQDKFFTLNVHYDLLSVLNSEFFERFPPISFQIDSFDLTNAILRC